MSYKIETEFQKFTEKSKDDVIALLMLLYSEATEKYLKVTWPDKTIIEYDGVDD